MLARRHDMMGANDVQAAQIDCVYEHGILLRFLIRLLVLSGSCNDTRAMLLRMLRVLALRVGW
jgi:hypothetical protein